MTIKDMYAKLDELKAEGKKAIETGALDVAEKIKAEIKTLETEIRNELALLEDDVAQARADLVDARSLKKGKLSGKATKTGNIITPEDYNNAVLDDLMGKATSEQKALITDMNDNIKGHTTETTPTVMPTQLVGAIWAKIEEDYPLFAAVPTTHIPAKITYDRNVGHSNESPWVGSESTPTPEVRFVFDKFDLNGHEVTLHVPFSFKLAAMSRTDFQAHLVAQMASLFGKALSQAIYDGTGSGMPTGIKTYLQNTGKGIIEYTSATYKTITDVLANLKSGLKSGLKIYANNATIWRDLANIVDENGRPMFIPHITTGQIGTLFGVRVVEAAELPDGEIMFGNLKAAYRLNVLEGISLARETDNMNRVVKHFLYSIVDGNVIDQDAVVILKKK